jgi:hypothetical protein
MKSARLVLIGGAAFLAVLLACLLVALNATFQTWLTRRMLAARPGLHLEIGRVSAGFGHVTLTDVHWQRGGVTLRAPKIEGDLPVITAVLARRFNFSQFVAHDWTVDASGTSSGVVASPGATAGAGAVATVAAARTFPGVFATLTLPADLSVGQADLQGEVLLPGAQGRASMTLSGGGLSAGHEGRFDVTAVTTLIPLAGRTVRVSGTVTASMDTPRTFSQLTADLLTAPEGAAARSPLAFRTQASARRADGAEHYVVTVGKSERQLLSVAADYPPDGQHIVGSWKVDLREADLRPLAHGHVLPTIVADGEGRLEADITQRRITATGRLNAAVEHLETLWPRLSEVGQVKLVADIDAAQTGDVLSISKLTIAVAAADRDVATVNALQSFAFNSRSGEVRAADPSHPLVGVSLAHFPVAWMQPFSDQLRFRGGDVHGELIATPRAGGLTVRTKAPLTVAKLDVARGDKPLLTGIDVSLNASGDYTPHGWQAEISGTTARSGAATILMLDAKAGKLAGADQPLKATGLLTVDLGALTLQPIAHAALPLQSGSASIEFAGSFGREHAVEAKVALTKLVADPHRFAGALPTLTANVRADVAEDHRVTIHAPLVIEIDGRQSDLTVAGVFTPAVVGGAFDAQVTSNRLIVEDAKPLLGLFEVAKAETSSGAPPSAPAWAGLTGTLALQLKQLVYSGTFEMNNVTGTIRLNGGTLKLDNVRAGLNEGGNAAVTAGVSFRPQDQPAYQAAADVALTDFNPATLLHALNPKLVPPIDGRFVITSRLTAAGNSFDALPAATAGQFEFTSKAGVFRGATVNVGNLVENSSKLASWIASAGSAIAGLVSRKEDYDEITSRSQAASELAKALSQISYDQLSVVVSRDEARNATVKEFTLISPDVRMTGAGRTQHQPGQPMLEDELALELHIRARGRPAELMKYLGVLEAKADDLGYSACTIPFNVSGTIGNPDGRDFGNRLIALAVEKTGILEKAGAKALDWVNRLRGR